MWNLNYMVISRDQRRAKMTTELVWSTVKPTFPEVKGKKLRHIFFDANGKPAVSEWRVNTPADYRLFFDAKFICYADLTATVSPLPLWGRMPRVISTIIHMEDKTIWSVYYEHHNVYFQLNNYATQELAILAWNRIAEALNEVEGGTDLEKLQTTKCLPFTTIGKKVDSDVWCFADHPTCAHILA